MDDRQKSTIEDIELQMSEFLPLRDVVFQTLRQAILSGRVQPGERLMEIHLARRLGVSRTPVREAIRKLELEGLVCIVPRKGAVVAEITQSDMEDVLEVRRALEDLAVRKASQCMSAVQLEALKAASFRFEECLREGDLRASAQADEDFHEIISEATGNLRLLQILNNLRSQIYRYRLENLKDKSSYPDLIRQHALIIEAMAAHDPEKASQVLGMHIEKQRVSIIESLRSKEKRY